VGGIGLGVGWDDLHTMGNDSEIRNARDTGRLGIQLLVDTDTDITRVLYNHTNAPLLSCTANHHYGDSLFFLLHGSVASGLHAMLQFPTLHILICRRGARVNIAPIIIILATKSWIIINTTWTKKLDGIFHISIAIHFALGMDDFDGSGSF
jgi:hypothetical protein